MGPNQQAFFREKLAENEERHAELGDGIYLLQPQLKDGLGGLRDLHTALWMVKVRYRVRSFRELVPLGVLASATSPISSRALDFLWRVRNAMHFVAGAAPGPAHASSSRTCWPPSSASGTAGPGVTPSCATSIRGHHGRIALSDHGVVRAVPAARTVTAPPARAHDPQRHARSPGRRPVGDGAGSIRGGAGRVIDGVRGGAAPRRASLAPATRQLLSATARDLWRPRAARRRSGGRVPARPAGTRRASPRRSSRCMRSAS